MLRYVLTPAPRKELGDKLYDMTLKQRKQIHGKLDKFTTEPESLQLDV